MIFEKNDILVMAGDSVTDCGRMYEQPAGGWGSFGDGYVSMVDAFLAALYPELHIMVANRGVSGDDIIKMEERWDKDVMALNPDWVSIMIGINDVWRQFDGLLMHVDTVSPTLFETTYRNLIERTLPHVKGIILISPIMIEQNNDNPMKQMLTKYAAIAKTLATEYNLLYVDVQSRVDAFLQELNEFILCSDRVHPNNKGHAIIAKAFLDTIGTDWTRP